ncbi:hypothetical protein L873DRAFT_67922 [Choiromyces venosus 120613-1]|uniref:Uncharacterized protein n=1 Tax=Choiromyces venosus 120613-1 TaxID=1336337 RepID=A0A3N4J9Z4_9PEZI|nr:hypothetical protein L873DRAFT_67922 [Choiromyces venosus 120613-1]
MTILGRKKICYGCRYSQNCHIFCDKRGLESSLPEPYLECNPMGPEVSKLKLILAYTLLYLTLKYGIVVALKEEYPQKSK